VQQNIQSAQGFVGSADLESAYQRVQEVIADAEEKRLARSRDIRGPLGELVNTLEGRAMEELASAQEQYFEGEHSAALARFEELTKLDGLRAAREAAGELRKEDDRAEWRELRDNATAQMDASDFVAAQSTLRDLTRLSRRTGYDAVADELLAEFTTTAQSHVDQAEQAIDAERYDDAYGKLYEISRLSALRAPSLQARRLLGENANDPGMRQAKLEYDANDALTEIREDLAEADGHRNADALRAQLQRKLTQLASQYEGTRAAEQAQQLADELGEKLASR